MLSFSLCSFLYECFAVRKVAWKIILEKDKSGERPLHRSREFEKEKEERKKLRRKQIGIEVKMGRHLTQS